MAEDPAHENDSPAYTGRELRASNRHEFALECAVKLEDSLSQIGFIRNISFTGAFVELRHYDNESIINQRARLFFAGDIENTPFAMHLSCTIVRAVKEGIGVQFRNNEREKVEEVIDLLEKKKEHADQNSY